jgi:hypothetical protein
MKEAPDGLACLAMHQTAGKGTTQSMHLITHRRKRRNIMDIPNWMPNILIPNQKLGIQKRAVHSILGCIMHC